MSIVAYAELKAQIELTLTTAQEAIGKRGKNSKLLPGLVACLQNALTDPYVNLFNDDHLHHGTSLSDYCLIYSDALDKGFFNIGVELNKLRQCIRNIKTITERFQAS